MVKKGFRKACTYLKYGSQYESDNDRYIIFQKYKKLKSYQKNIIFLKFLKL